MSFYFKLLKPCLIPFKCQYISGSSVVYHNFSSELSNEKIIEIFSFISFDSNDDIPPHVRIKTFYAEAYGGGGIGSHGGGARCGYDGDLLQIKGIGKNPLTSNKHDVTGQSDGILLLSSAIYEVLWSEILSRVLPFGSIKCLAIIVIDNHPLANEKIKDYRALLIRKITLRPAHFERAPYFKKKLTYALDYVKSDRDRVFYMHKRLNSYLSNFNENADIHDASNFDDYIILFASRQAHQLAFSVCNLIYHSVSSSNITLDGPWLDFTSTGVIGCDSKSKNKYFIEFFISLMKQSEIIKSTLQSFIFYHAKYLHLNDNYYIKCLRIANHHFNKNYRNEIIFNLLCIAGVEKNIARAIVAKKTVISMYKQFLLIIKKIIFNNEIHENKSISKYGFIFFSFHSLFMTIKFSQHIDLCSYNKIREQVLNLIMDEYQKININKTCAARMISITASRLSGWKKELSYNEIMKVIHSIIHKHDVPRLSFEKSVAGVIENINRRANFHLDYASNNKTLCWSEKKFTLVYCAATNKFFIRLSTKTLVFHPSNKFYNFLLTQKTYRKMIAFYSKIKSTSLFF